MSHIHFGRAVPIVFRRFPSIVCHNLLGNTVRVPEDLEGQLNALVVGFKASHYACMNSWIPFVNRLAREVLARFKIGDPVLQVYRLVIRHRSGVVVRWWTDERLRLAVGYGDSELDGFTASKSLSRDEQLPFNTRNPVRSSATAALEQIPAQAGCSGETYRTSAKLRSVRSRTLVCFTDKSAFVEALQLADCQRVYVFLVDRQGGISWCEHEHYSPAKEVELRDLLQLDGKEGPPQLECPGNLLLSPAKRT